jgi:hypothetical protein
MKCHSKAKRAYRYTLSAVISFALVVAVCVTTGHATPAYPVQVVSENEVFIINGYQYEAMTACEGITEGDWVIFLQGNPYGTCSSAIIQNLHTGATCNLWCD